MNRSFFFIVAVLTALLVGGCFSTRIIFDRDGQPVPNYLYQNKSHHGLVNGLVELSAPIHLSALCPSGVAYVEQQTSFINSLVSGFTGAFYTPQAVSVHCLSGETSEAILDEKGEMIAYLPL